MHQPKVSIIIPVYNGEKTLESCLKSIIKQSYISYEVILVDNNSTDLTKKIINNFSNKDDRIHYLLEKKRSRGAAYNAGINFSTGEIIVFTHADCLFSLNWLEQIIRPISADQAKAVLGFITDLKKNFWTKNIQQADQLFYQRNQQGEYINMIDTRNFAIRSELIKATMFDPEIVSLEDLDLYLRLKKLIKISFFPNITVGHWHRSNFISVVKSNFDRAYWSARIYLKYYGHEDLSDVSMFKSISIFNFLTLPIWLVLNFFTKSTSYASFLVVTEFSWRPGLIWGLIKNRKT